MNAEESERYLRALEHIAKLEATRPYALDRFMPGFIAGSLFIAAWALLLGWWS